MSRPRTGAAVAPLQRILSAYENFLQSQRLAELGVDTAVDVFGTAQGGLVCEWSEEIAKERVVKASGGALPGLVALGNYESFLASPEAHGIDPAVGVFFTSNGGLVCHLP